MGLCQSNTSKNNSQPTRGYRIVNLTNHAEDNKKCIEKSRGYGAEGFEELMDGFKDRRFQTARAFRMSHGLHERRLKQV
jgi:hypothetical protein